MPASDELFTIIKTTHEPGTVSAWLTVNADSEILAGHFPGHPVVPGASMLQILKDVLESALSLQIRLIKADHLKFISLIEPAKANELRLVINYRHEGDNRIFAIGNLTNNGAVCFKFQGYFAL